MIHSICLFLSADNAITPADYFLGAKADEVLRNTPDLDHEYLPIGGLASFTSAAQRLILGADSPVIKENRVCLLSIFS